MIKGLKGISVNWDTGLDARIRLRLREPGNSDFSLSLQLKEISGLEIADGITIINSDGAWIRILLTEVGTSAIGNPANRLKIVSCRRQLFEKGYTVVNLELSSADGEQTTTLMMAIDTDQVNVGMYGIYLPEKNNVFLLLEAVHRGSPCFL